jgi:hypothetical protein
MQCTLLIPHLFWPGAAAATVTQGLALPQLTKLLARSRLERCPAVTREAWLCQAFGVERQQDWPVAPLTLTIDGEDPANHYWLRADPVHLKVARDRLVLVDSSLFEVTSEECRSMLAALNLHFAQSGLAFHASHPKRWYVRLPREPALITHALSEVAGEDVRRYLPSGADALVWHGVFNETQMLLHEHAVNENRDARGEPAVNSVWFWGGGTRPVVPGRVFQRVWSDDALAVGLAAGAVVPADAAPRDAVSWLQQLPRSTRSTESHLITIDDLAAAVAYQDPDAWRTRMAALEERWIGPLVQAVRERRVSQITLVALGETHCCRFVAAALDLMKLWRRSRMLSAYA